ncbi:DarT ssDNA thymidine ADP-ribosyltransferase family protein [Pseudomonas gingeri]|uniref:DarT ssDNA thymidine ADP-ribosyltransferase family protein n=1 Tax=Pseudomonas gingeri TaxID=117681 RepID=UPI0015BAE9C8|nr:DarT ssDNA thymidine ADP-ribosyltransferase family protein [Pseudomonas gingeri]NWD47484.1 DUF4433 domain-containing protein [Pseudomonas gingeri]NWE72771.1 DUF4433 domain-containing protein [Pseudomonas gingeri]
MKDSIQQIIEKRKISEILHFTSNHGLVGTLATKYLLSRRALPKNDHLAYIAAPTADKRQEAEDYFNKDQDWLDYINLSISEINVNYFDFATKWHNHKDDRWWVILSFSPEILEHKGVHFTTTNNIYEHVNRAPFNEGLEKLFNDTIKRKGSWTAYRRERASHLATCQQAEVLYPEQLDIAYLKAVYVRNGDEHDLVSGWLSYYNFENIDVIINEAKFLGQPN